jgi:hypothetical protein
MAVIILAFHEAWADLRRGRPHHVLSERNVGSRLMED